MPKRRADSPGSGDDLDWASDYATTETNARKKRQRKRHQTTILSDTRPRTTETITPNINQHLKSTHVIDKPNEVRGALLSWYSGVHATRGMPWRKPFDPSHGNEARAQRAYEVTIVYWSLFFGGTASGCHLGVGIRDHAPTNPSGDCHPLLQPVDGQVRFFYELISSRN